MRLRLGLQLVLQRALLVTPLALQLSLLLPSLETHVLRLHNMRELTDTNAERKTVQSHARHKFGARYT